LNYLLCLYVLVISGVAWKEVSNVKHKLGNLVLDNHIANHWILILSVFVSLCDGCKPSEQRVSLDPRCNFFTQCYKGCSANSMASSHPFPELTGVPQSHSHFVNVIFNFGNMLLFMCCFCLLTQLSRLVHFLSVVYCSALIVQLSGLVHFLSVVYCSALIV